MRVVAGKFRGARLFALKGNSTRPTTDLVKESLFNVIQGYFPCENVLDLFAGSGALGFEALSRGAEHCVFVENNRAAIDVIRKNAAHLKLATSNFEIKQQDFAVYIKSLKEKFDVIFLDPPYNKDYLSKAVFAIQENKILADGGILVVESEIGGEEINFAGFEVVKEKQYGRVQISILRGDFT